MVGWSVGFLMGTVLVRWAGGALWRLAREHLRLTKKVADSLDTSTPGGLSDVVDAVRGLNGHG